MSECIAYNTPPQLELSNSTLNTTIGASFSPIFIRVQGEHAKLQISPELPLGLSIVPVPSYLFAVYGHGYLITGECDVDGQWATNFCIPHGSDSICASLEINVMPVSLSPSETHTVMKMEITDSILDSSEYRYDLYLDDALIFNRSQMLNSRSILYLNNELKGRYRLNVCRRKELEYEFVIIHRMPLKQEVIQIQILADNWTPVFSTCFIGRSVTELYPCRWYTFTMIKVVTSTSNWKYIRSASSMPFNWRDFDFDDSLWNVGRYQYPIQTSESVYLRQHVKVGINRCLEYRFKRL